MTNLEKFVYSQNWEAIITRHENNHHDELLEQYYYNLALSNLDQLCEKLFFVPQTFGVESLILPRKNEYIEHAIYLYYAIGLISEAHHLAYELMVKDGYRPETLKMLVKTNIINGNYKIAERYINILKRTHHHKDWGLKYEGLILNPNLIGSDQELARKINMLPQKDFFIRTDDIQNIELFLQANPFNRRAFEYKMARLLIDKDIITMVYEIKKMRDIGYSKIPRYIEEAILEYWKSTGDLPDLGSLVVSSETEGRFIRYNNTLKLNKNLNELHLKIKMKEEWGDTFWYYYKFQ